MRSRVTGRPLEEVLAEASAKSRALVGNRPSTVLVSRDELPQQVGAGVGRGLGDVRDGRPSFQLLLLLLLLPEPVPACCAAAAA
jgi:hypothetical protein